MTLRWKALELFLNLLLLHRVGWRRAVLPPTLPNVSEKGFFSIAFLADDKSLGSLLIITSYLVNVQHHKFVMPLGKVLSTKSTVESGFAVLAFARSHRVHEAHDVIGMHRHQMLDHQPWRQKLSLAARAPLGPTDHYLKQSSCR